MYKANLHMNNLSNILMNIKSSNNDELHLIFLEHLLYLHKGIYSKLGNNNIFSEIYLTIQCFLTIQFLWYTSSPAIKSHTLVSSCDLIDRPPAKIRSKSYSNRLLQFVFSDPIYRRDEFDSNSDSKSSNLSQNCQFWLSFSI